MIAPTLIRVFYLLLAGQLAGCFLPEKLHAQKNRTNTVSFEVVQTAGSPSVKPYRFSRYELAPEINWTADWIWLDPIKFPQYQRTKTTWLGPEQKNPPYRVFFRKEWSYKPGDEPVYLYCTADVRFRLSVNGRIAAEGPVNTGGDYDDRKAPDYWYYSIYDISSLLKPGKNSIAVEVMSWALEWSEITRTYGGFLAEIKAGSQTLLKSDTSWKAIPDTSLNRVDDWLIWQADKEIPGWQTQASAALNWPAAAIQTGAPATKLFRSGIPELMQATIQPLELVQEKTVESGEYLLDFSRNRVARIQCSFTANKGDTIEIVPFEKMGYTASPSRAIRLIAKEGKNNFRSLNLAAFRYLRVRIAASAKITLHSLNAVFTTYPVSYQGSFSCSDPFYTQLWSIARYTTQLCMSDMFFDSPMHQEPNACTGDYYIEALNAYYAFGDAWLTRQNIIQTAQQLRKNDSRMFHTSYSLIWIQMVQQYIMYTGDAGVLPEILPVADELADLFNTYLNKEYLVANAPNYMFMDWIKIDRFSAHHPPAMIGTGYMTAFYYKALRELAWLHSWAGKQGINYASATKASRYTKLADNIRNGIEKNLWDPAKGLYRDGIAGMSTSSPSFWLPADTAIETHSAHFNTLVVLYDIAPKERQADLLHYVVTQESYELQPYFMSYVLAAFTQLGKTTEGLLQVNRWINGIDTSTYTLKENWQDVSATGYRGDYSHAWGGAALWFCSRNLLGVSSYTPGYQQIALHPYDGATITWAKGTVPVGNNEVVDVDWKKEPAKLWWKYKLPLHRTAIVLLPESWRTKKIRINGKPVKYQPRLTLATNTILLEVQ